MTFTWQNPEAKASWTPTLTALETRDASEPVPRFSEFTGNMLHSLY